jgi:rhamnose transport system ATP-binding protein
MRVDVVGINKSSAGAPALEDVSLTIAAGSIHGMVGENGAGKSTLGKIIARVQPADSGQILIDGRPAAFASPRDALDAGTAIIQQELALMPQ